MTIQKRHSRGFACVALITLFLAAGVSAQTTAPETSMKKIAGIVKATGRTYTTLPSGALMVDTPRDKLLVVGKGNFLIMTFGQILPKTYLPRTDTVLFNLMRLNDSLNFSKVGIDSDGNLFLRVETRTEVVDKYDFDRTVKQLVEDYDRVKNAVFQPAPGTK